MGDSHHSHLAIVGPTATGKTALALELARCRPGIELVSVDSMSVYRRMDIGTAKPTEAERTHARYHLIDIADPSEDFTVTRFQRAALTVIREIEERGATAVLVGGTGLYLRAVIDRLEIPGRWPEISEVLDDQKDLEGLYHQLQQMDPTAATRIEPGNRRRIVRALEVTLGSGRPFSSFGPGLDEYPETHFRQVGLDMELALLYQRIGNRFRAQMTAGLLEEVKALSQIPGGLSKTARQALGYRELLGHLEDGVPLEEAVTEAVRRTRRFARRQLAWFRRDPRVYWVPIGANPLAALDAVLGQLDG